MRRYFPAAVFVFCATMIAGYFAMAYVLDSATRRALGSVTANASRLGFRMREARFTAVHLNSLYSAHWENFSGSFRFARDGSKELGPEYRIGVERATLALDDLRGPRFELRLKGVRVWPADPKNADDRMVGRSMRFVVPMNPLRPREAAVETGRVFRGLGELVRSGSTAVPFGFDGKLVFRLSKEKKLEGRLSALSDGGRYFLAVDAADMRKISSALREPLTEAESESLRRRPLDLPQILRDREKD